MAITLWITLSIIGLLFASFSMLSSYNRWRLAVVAVPDNKGLILMARSTFLTQFSHFLIFCILLTIGILALIEHLSTVFPWLMFIINIILVTATVREYRFRKHLYRGFVRRPSGN